jgi:beta-alanine degradation protein BauB
MATPMDPVESNPGLYSVVFENDRVRVLEYRDEPGAESVPHDHPDSVMITLSSFQRELRSGDRVAAVELPAEAARWLSAQNHSGFNTGTTPTHCIFVELKEPPLVAATGQGALGPAAA